MEYRISLSKSNSYSEENLEKIMPIIIMRKDYPIKKRKRLIMIDKKKRLKYILRKKEKKNHK